MARHVRFLLASLILSTHSSTDAVTWQYGPNSTCSADGVCGALAWGTRPENVACKEVGTQSPIDASFSSAVESKSYSIEDFTMKKITSPCSEATFIVNDHTSEVKLGRTCPTSFKSTWQGKPYYLKQLNWHSPSEHTIDGKYFPMEVQFVHATENTEPEPFLIISVMIGVIQDVTTLDENDIDAETFATETQYGMPWPMGEVEKAVNWTKFGPYDFIPSLDKGYYTYEGSLTTPPCTTNVRWILSPKPRYVTQATLDHYRQHINGLRQNAPFKEVLGLNTSVPEWSSTAWGMPPANITPTSAQWDPSYGTNIRPIQPLIGATKADRKFVHVSAHDPLLAETDKPYLSSGSVANEVITGLLSAILACCCCMICGVYFFIGQMDKGDKRQKSHIDYDAADEESGEGGEE